MLCFKTQENPALLLFFRLCLEGHASLICSSFLYSFVHSLICLVNKHGQTQAMCWREKNKLAALKELETPFQESVIKKEKNVFYIYMSFLCYEAQKSHYIEHKQKLWHEHVSIGPEYKLVGEQFSLCSLSLCLLNLVFDKVRQKLFNRIKLGKTSFWRWSSNNRI